MLLNPQQIQQLYEYAAGNNVEILNEIITECSTNFLQLLGMLENAVSGQNMEQVYRLAHTLKGQSGMLGAADLAQRCYQLEQATNPRQGMTCEVEVMETLAKQIRMDYQQALDAVHIEIQQHYH